MCAFDLCEGLNKKLFITDLSISRVLLNDTKNLPWVLLVPRVAGAAQLVDLSFDEQIQVLREIDTVSRAMQKLFPCDRLNVAAIGNKTPQLHIHIICRSKDDPYWPETVWQYKCEKMSAEESNDRASIIREALEKYKQ